MITPFVRPEGGFVLSRKPTAILRNSYNLLVEETSWGEQKGWHWHASVAVITVRGTKARPSLTIGHIGQSGVQADWRWDNQPTDVDDFMLNHADSFNGVRAEATWDGRKIWTASNLPSEINVALAVLEPALRRLLFPIGSSVPEGYDGWWLASRDKKEKP